MMMNTISRVAALLAEGQEGTLQRCLQNSFLVSADMAHALHPNYPEKCARPRHALLGWGLGSGFRNRAKVRAARWSVCTRKARTFDPSLDI